MASTGAPLFMPRRKKTGRPSKLTPACTNAIVTAIKVGTPFVHAAHAAGISYDTFRKWIVRGMDEESGPFKKFFNDVKKAEGEFVLNNLAIIQKAAMDGAWQAAAWKLERRYPQDFGRKFQTEGGQETTMSSDEADSEIKRSGDILKRHGFKLLGRTGTTDGNGRKAKNNGDASGR